MFVRVSTTSRQRSAGTGAGLTVGDVLADEAAVALGDEVGAALEAAHPARATGLIDEARRLFVDESDYALIAY